MPNCRRGGAKRPTACRPERSEGSTPPRSTHSRARSLAPLGMTASGERVSEQQGRQGLRILDLTPPDHRQHRGPTQRVELHELVRLAAVLARLQAAREEEMD